MKETLRKVMKRAWEIKRENVRNIFGLCLKMAWAEIKATVKTVGYQIADWFMNKNLDKVTTEHLMCYSNFFENEIIKETEKAYYVELPMRVKGSGAESRYTRKVWVPKSVVSTYRF